MEQLYLLEIFVDKVRIFPTEDEPDTGARKKLTIRTMFGPRTQFIIRESQMAPNKTADDVIKSDANGRRSWSRSIRVGKSYLFSSFPDSVLITLSKFPLEIQVYDDEIEKDRGTDLYVGIGTMEWDVEFYQYLKETSNVCKIHESLAIKQTAVLFAECCCRICGEVDFILRLTALGNGVITEFQQLMTKDPEKFVFRTNKAPSMFECKRIEGDNPNFTMAGSIYETTTLEDPDVVDEANKKIEVCTELQSCGITPGGPEDLACKHVNPNDTTPKKEYPLDKIRMGDITGPCGNTNCPLAHRIKNYIRNLDAYKKQVPGGRPPAAKDQSTRKVCGACDCKDDRYHRGTCRESGLRTETNKKAICEKCGGVTQAGESCDDKKNKMFDTGLTPKGSNTNPQVRYMTGISRSQDLMKSLFGNDFTVQNVQVRYDTDQIDGTRAQSSKPTGCCCREKSSINPSTMRNNTPTPDFLDSQVHSTFSAPTIPTANKTSSRSFFTNNQLVYNVDGGATARLDKCPYPNCLEVSSDKECKCIPQRSSPPCRTFDCECIQEMVNKTSRKVHRSYCPNFKHKANCPVTMMAEEGETPNEEEEEPEPLPYGLPPVQLGPCPVLGRPCTVPDGFARMYKTGAMTALPTSYSEAGKVCCSKEYERIKKAIKEYMKFDKDNDVRCVNRFNVDTETRCCDKEQALLALMGKGCCGAHKLSIQEKYNTK